MKLVSGGIYKSEEEHAVVWAIGDTGWGVYWSSWDHEETLTKYETEAAMVASLRKNGFTYTGLSLTKAFIKWAEQND